MMYLTKELSVDEAKSLVFYIASLMPLDPLQYIVYIRELRSFTIYCIICRTVLRACSLFLQFLIRQEMVLC